MLFNQVFGKEFDDELWIHFYENNPCGLASGIFCFFEDDLVGYNVLLPQEMGIKADASTKFYGLSGSTMIHQNHRKGGFVFSSFCELIEKEAERRRMEFILGYPNIYSLKPFLIFGQWELIDQAVWLKGELTKGVAEKIFLNQCKKFFFTPKVWNWRISQKLYFFEKGFLCKIFEGEKNYLDCVLPDQIKSINGIFPWWQSFGEPEADLFSFDKIHLCGKKINTKMDFSQIKRSVLFSDLY